MRVALVHDWLVNPGGSEEVFREILRLYPGVVFSSQANRAKFSWLEGVEVRTSYVQRLPWSMTKQWIYSPLVTYVYPSFNLSEFDLVLSDSHSFAHGVVKRPDAVHVNYYHTPARSLWSPEIDSRAQGFLKQRMAGWLKKRDLVFSTRPDVIFSNSKTTAERIRRSYGRTVDRVIYPPVNTDRFLKIERKSEEEGYLMWGRLVAYKRFDLAIDTAKELGFRLNIVGNGPLREELEKRASGAANIRFHGRLPDAALEELMSRSKAVLFPCYEDFGIVPVEAMAAGLPVVAYAQGGAAETVTSEFGVQMQHLTVTELARAIGDLERRDFAEAGLRQHSQDFDVEVFRSAYRAGVEEALSNRRVCEPQ
jgi:glycosyltransferase involved in cell wall biosynthesis